MTEKKWYKVAVVHKGIFGGPAWVHKDGILGISKEDALKNAKWNWDNAIHCKILGLWEE